MTVRRTLVFVAAVLLLCCAPAWPKDATTDQAPAQEDAAPIDGGKPVTTTIIKRCPAGYELVIRANGQRGCARNIVPPSE